MYGAVSSKALNFKQMASGRTCCAGGRFVSLISYSSITFFQKPQRGKIVWQWYVHTRGCGRTRATENECTRTHTRTLIYSFHVIFSVTRLIVDAGDQEKLLDEASCTILHRGTMVITTRTCSPPHFQLGATASTNSFYVALNLGARACTHARTLGARGRTCNGPARRHLVK